MVKRINIALQGGGAHGAFTWGVLDRLLRDERIEFAAISGTSAGALNGAALKSGLLRGGRDGARANLDWLWAQVGAVGDMRLSGWMTALAPPPALMSDALASSVSFAMADTATRVFSPYAYGPFYLNPLERIARQFHYDAVCADDGPRFYVGATNVRSGKIRVFTGDEITTDAILASACLPTLFKAVEIEDPETGTAEAYWDGGYSGNPALFPLFDPALPDDILVININPLYRAEVPTSAPDIQNRINEISFNASLLRELRAIAFVRRLIAEGAIRKGAMKDVLVHMIADDALMTMLSVATKLVPTPGVLGQLKLAGQTAADRFLNDHFDSLNTASTIDLDAMFG